jgi:2-succinyl-6-hydroxy-2,4-cyclohexadiene-1-carboxylate synthase
MTIDPFHLPRRTVDAAGVRIAVAEPSPLADSTPLLVLHGFTGCAEAMLAVAEPLAGHRRVLLPDLVGHGRSEVATVDRCTMPSVVDQLLAVLDAAGIAAVDVVGYSMGGRVALHLAVAAPERVRRVVTIGASPGLADPVARAARVAADEALAARIRTVGIERFVAEWESQPLFASQVRLAPAVLAAQRVQRLASDPEGLARSLEGMGTGAMAPLHDVLPHLAVPVLLLAGAEDAKFVAASREMAAMLPMGATGVIEAVGHAAHLEAPVAVADAVTAFLA